MFGRTVTIFSKHHGSWYPRVFNDTQISRDRGYITRTYGETANETISVDIKRINGKAEGKYDFYEPKAWSELQDVTGKVAFNTGDILWEGDYSTIDANLRPIEDASVPKGFYSYFRGLHDMVYALTQTATYVEIPHWEIAGR